MSILSVGFLLFALGLCLAYFLVPKRFQWWVLLAFSLAFYALGGLLSLPWLLLTACTVWAAARWSQHPADAEKARFAGLAGARRARGGLPSRRRRPFWRSGGRACPRRSGPPGRRGASGRGAGC